MQNRCLRAATRVSLYFGKTGLQITFTMYKIWKKISDKLELTPT